MTANLLYRPDSNIKPSKIVRGIVVVPRTPFPFFRLPDEGMERREAPAVRYAAL
jgi:hypothetical protein